MARGRRSGGTSQVSGRSLDDTFSDLTISGDDDETFNKNLTVTNIGSESDIGILKNPLDGDRRKQLRVSNGR